MGIGEGGKGAREGFAIHIILCDVPGGEKVYGQGGGGGRVYSTIAYLSLPRAWTCTFLRFDCSRESFSDRSACTGQKVSILQPNLGLSAQRRAASNCSLAIVLHSSCVALLADMPLLRINACSLREVQCTFRSTQCAVRSAVF